MNKFTAWTKLLVIEDLIPMMNLRTHEQILKRKIFLKMILKIQKLNKKCLNIKYFNQE